jgi:hypothetical protein
VCAPYSPVIEREKEREKEGGRERERGWEKERKRESEKHGERVACISLFLFLSLSL